MKYNAEFVIVFSRKTMDARFQVGWAWGHSLFLFVNRKTLPMIKCFLDWSIGRGVVALLFAIFVGAIHYFLTPIYF